MAPQESCKYVGKYLGIMTRKFYATVGIFNKFMVQCPPPWPPRSIKNDVHCFDYNDRVTKSVDKMLYYCF